VIGLSQLTYAGVLLAVFACRLCLPIPAIFFLIAWLPKHRKRVLIREGPLRVRDLIRQIAIEHEIAIVSG
jgi:hypothetical protein